MVWWLAATPCLFKCVLLLVLIHSVIVMVLTSSECNQTRFDQSCSDGAIHQRLIYTPNDNTGIRPSISCNSRRWFQSPDGGPSNISLSSKHTVDANNNLRLNLSNISGSDEGIYGCQFDDGIRDNQICIKVYGKAVFASCPHELTCTENETLTLPANGGSVSFNATVIHIGGGSCGFRQNLSFVKLIKINETTGECSKLLYICNYGAYLCRPQPEDRNNVNFTEGHSGFEFIFTLSNVTTDDVGTYAVLVERKKPQEGSIGKMLSKTFRLVETPTSAEITPTTSLPPTTTSEANTTIVTSTTPPASISQTSHSVATILGAITGAALFVTIIIIVVTVVLFRKSYKACSRKQMISQSSEERSRDVNPSSPIYQQDEQNQLMRYNTITIAYNHNGNEGTVTHTPNPETFIGQPELPTPNDTMSINGDIELADGRNMNSHPEMV